MWNDEKDYIMRMIREISRVIFSLMFGKQYVQVEVNEQEKYRIAGKDPEEYKRMVDRGEINEAENLLLENLNYQSKEEALDGMKQLAKEVGYDGIWDEF